MFALVDYNAAAAGVNAANLDMSAVADPEFSGRNSHYIFTEPYTLGAAMLVGASVTRGRFQVPTWNAIGEGAIFNANRALQPPSNPQLDLYTAYAPRVPMNEEFQVQVSNNLGAATEQENCLLWLLPDGWTPTLPRGMLPIVAQATFTATPTINVWSGPFALTFTQALRGGVYAVVGATCQGTNAVAFRLIFPKAKAVNGRKLRPGGPIQTALGDVLSNQLDPWQMAWGEWGRFNTFEPPQIELLGTTAGAITYRVFLWLVYVSDQQNL